MFNLKLKKVIMNKMKGKWQKPSVVATAMDCPVDGV